jgi:hypothetical protein
MTNRRIREEILRGSASRGNLHLEECLLGTAETPAQLCLFAKPEVTIMKDASEKLSQILHEWTPEPVNTDEVRREVWRRIEKLKPSTWKTWLAFLDGIVARPVVATGALAVAVAAGMMIGTMASSAAQTESYLQSVTAFHQEG